MTGMTVTAIEPAASRVTLDDGRNARLRQAAARDRCRAAPDPDPGRGLHGVYYLRTLADCDAAAGAARRRRAGRGRRRRLDRQRVRRLGAPARTRGHRYRPAPLPNERVFGAEIEAFYRDVHAQHGVELLLGEGVESFEGDRAVARVQTGSAQSSSATSPWSGSASCPAVGLAREAGLEVENGSSSTRSSGPRRPASSPPATSRTPGIRSTSGESGSSTGRTRLIRGPRRRGRCSASRSATTASPTSSPTSTRSGWSTRATRRVGRGRVPRRARGRRVHRVLAARRAVAAGMNVNVWDVNDHVQALIRSRQPVEAAALRSRHTA